MKNALAIVLAAVISVPAVAYAFSSKPSRLQQVACPECGPVPVCPIGQPKCDDTNLR